MYDLIRVSYESENPTVSARELHEFLGVTSKYNDWFNRMKEYGFEQETDYLAIAQKKVTAQGNESVYQDHQLTIPMAKELAMLQRNDKGKQARRYFIALEAAWNTPEQVMARALKLAEAQMNSLKKRNTMLTTQIQQDKPKVLFADAVSTARSEILIGELAKILKQNGIDTGEKRLFEWLRENEYLIKRKGTDYNAPTQRSMELGLFRVKETVVTHGDGHVTVCKTTKVTGKGQVYFVERLLG